MSKCPLLQEAERLVFENTEFNMNLAMDLQGNQINGELRLFIPHFDLKPEFYTVAVTGESIQSFDGLTTSLRLTQAAPATVGTFQISLTQFDATQGSDTLQGSLTLVLTDTNEATYKATVTYAFKLDKIL